ncbi:hypothetical protein [Aeromicrobium sp.]|nr:hypothetical protein [Aeromicrobium sp.]
MRARSTSPAMVVIVVTATWAVREGRDGKFFFMTDLAVDGFGV